MNELKESIAKTIYDLITRDQPLPSGKEFEGYLECRVIALCLIEKYNIQKMKYALVRILQVLESGNPLDCNDSNKDFIKKAIDECKKLNS